MMRHASLLDDDEEGNQVSSELLVEAPVEGAVVEAAADESLSAPHETVTVSSETLEQLQQRHHNLLQRYHEIRTARRDVARHCHAARLYRAPLHEAAHVAHGVWQQRLVHYASLLAWHQRQVTRLLVLQQWNVVQSDALPMECHVPSDSRSGATTHAAHSTDSANSTTATDTVATINGLRLGCYTVVHTRAVDAVTRTLPISNRFFPFGPAPPPASSSQASKLPLPPNVFAGTLPNAACTIPWREINAALGQVALVVSLLRVTPCTHAKYDVVCKGSTSRIGLFKTPPSAIVYYNLYYIPSANESTTPHSSGWASYFMGPPDRNLNTALTMLLDCIASLATVLCQRDPTIQIPYAMHVDQGTIGGVPIVRFATATCPTPADTWTRAMKYLLTNLKHLMACRGLGLFATPVDV